MPRMRASPLLILFLAASALSPGHAEARRVSANTQKLYDELDQASTDYRAGLAQLRKGETAAGREAVRDASARLSTATRRCEDTRGCEVERFVAAYDALLQHGADVAAG